MKGKKDKQVLELWGPIRENNINSHQFYVNQAQKRLLSQFDNIEEEADNYEKEWIKKYAKTFDADDSGEIIESAYDQNISYYSDLLDLKDQTRFSIVAGMYHKWDKEVREWLIRDLKFYPQIIIDQLWNKDIGKIYDLLEGMGWSIRNSNFYEKLDACRLIVNVYKHGNGISLNELKKNYPNYLEDPFAKLSSNYTSNLNYKNLKLTDDHFQEFSQAITDFWEQAPKYVMKSEISTIPKWK